MATKFQTLRTELRDAWIGEGNSKRITFRNWVQNMADNPRGTLQKAAREYLRSMTGHEMTPTPGPCRRKKIMTTTLTKNQTKQFSKAFTNEHGALCKMTVTVRHDDRCGNGHNTFSITADLWEGSHHSCGCLHKEVAKHFPELEHLIKWHLCSTDGPMHYLANTAYHVKEGHLDAARHSAIWPHATDEDLTAPGLRERLEERLPVLLWAFRNDVESQLLGFTY